MRITMGAVGTGRASGRSIPTLALALVLGWGVCAAGPAAQRARGAQESPRATVDPRLPEYKPAAVLSGELTAVGADTMETLMKLWIQDFAHYEPGIHIENVSKVSGAAAPALIAGTAELGPVAREMLPRETEDFEKRFGYPPVGIAVAGGSQRTKGKTHAIAIYVNKANPLSRLTLAQLDAILSTTRNRGYRDLTRWGQLGLGGKWKNAPIHIYGVKQPNGIAHFMQMRVLEGGRWSDGITSLTTVGSLNALDAITLAIGKDPDGIGYAGFQDANPDVKTVALAEKKGGPYYRGTFEEVLSHDYPLSRVIYIYVNRQPGRALDPRIDAFLQYILSRQGQDQVVKEGIFLPLPYRILEQERAKLGGAK
ncbi:MAG TPA: substrate-binding domain-containing protein [Candidatus Acidoferrales bacterium]|nr:substrate-binding domain-containing protein [Candidatus Acidoferrales bacterium]